MFNYLKINDPFRFIVIIFLLLLVRLPFYFYGGITQQNELQYLLLGQKVSEGFWLYSEIYTSIGPLAGWLYGLLDFLFGSSLVAHHILNFLLIAIQCFLFGKLINGNKATFEQTAIPVLLFGLFMSLSPASYTLSPFVLAQTFILLALNFQFSHLEFRIKRDEKIFAIGIYFAIAALFMQSLTIFMGISFLIFILFTNTLLRRYFLLAYGFILPILLLPTIYLLKGHAGDLYLVVIGLFDQGVVNGLTGLGKVWIVPAIYFSFSILAIAASGRFSNYQSTLIQVMFIWMVSCGLIFYLSDGGSPILLHLFTLPVAFFTTHFFLIVKRKRLINIAFYFLLFSIVGTNLLHVYRPSGFDAYLGNEERLTENSWTDTVEGKRILVLGPQVHYYYKAKHASRFFDWRLSEKYFTSTPDYGNISEVFQGIMTDFPDIIIDEDNLMGKFMPKIPEIRENYEKIPGRPAWKKI